MVQPIGRPRTQIPEKEEVVELGKDLVKWASEPSELPRTLWSSWYAAKHWFIKKQWEALKVLPEFKCYYEVARALMAQKLHAGVIEKGLAHRYLGYYDRDVYDYEDKEADKKVARQQKIDDTKIGYSLDDIVATSIDKHEAKKNEC